MVTTFALATLLAAPGTTPTIDPGYCDPKDPKHCALPLQRGQTAPFDGQLLTPDLAIDLGLKADYCAARTQLEVEFTKKLAEIDLNLEKELRKVDAKAHQEATTLLLGRLEAAVVPWHERPWFVSSVTFVGTVVAVSLAVWGAGQLSR